MNITEQLQRPTVRTVLWVIGCGAAAILAVGIIFIVISIRATQVDNTARQQADRRRDAQTAAAADAAARSVERIEDCTTPGRQCFEDAEKRTSRAVAGINDGTLAVIVAALSCQEDGITEQRPLARCTARRAAESTVKPQPQEDR